MQCMRSAITHLPSLVVELCKNIFIIDTELFTELKQHFLLILPTGLRFRCCHWTKMLVILPLSVICNMADLELRFLSLPAQGLFWDSLFSKEIRRHC